MIEINFILKMLNIKINSFFIFIFISFFCNQAIAYETPEIKTNYSVEVIIFRYLDQASVENELFDNNITPIDAYKETAVIKKQSVSYTNTALDNKENISEQIINNIIRTVPSDREILFNIIPNNLLSLKSDNDRLKRIRVYEPIIWNGWQQILTSNELTPEIKLRRLKNTLGQFGGYLKFYESSGGKLRLAVDIYMQDEQVNQAKLIGQTFPNNLAKIADEPPISKYPLSDDKEMKLDEIRYFDHPKYGILAKISKIQPLETNEIRTEVEIKPAFGDVFSQESSKKNYISSIERGIVGLGKTGKFISLTLNKNGNFVTNIADQLAIDKLTLNELVNDTFIYTISDGKNTQQKELIIEIIGVNDPPLSQDKIIALDNYSPYSFKLNDFFYEDVEESNLDHIVITRIPKSGTLYLEYPFGIWDVDIGMHISPTEIPYLKYKSLIDKDQDSIELVNEENSTKSIYFKVNDGKSDSKINYKIKFEILISKNTDSENIKDSAHRIKKYNNIIHLIQN